MFGFKKKAKAAGDPVDPKAPATLGDVEALRAEVALAFGAGDDTIEALAERYAALDAENAAILSLLTKLDVRVIDSLTAPDQAKLVELAAARGIRTKAALDQAEAKASRARFKKVDQQLAAEGEASADAR